MPRWSRGALSKIRYTAFGIQPAACLTTAADLQGNPYPFYDININHFNTLYKLLDSNTGYVFLKTTFTLPSDFKHKEVGLAIGRVKIAAKIYINNHSIGKSGNFPPHEFIEGNKTFAYKIPKEY